MNARPAIAWVVTLLTLGSAEPSADDWPEFRGKGRLGIWSETGILDRFPPSGLQVKWRTPVHGGHSGPSVADGRVFLTDARAAQGRRRIERVLALDERTGAILWTQEWEADYGGLGYDNGPRAAPTVDGDRVYVLGAIGTLRALNVADGEILWQKDYVKDFGATPATWSFFFGWSSAPLVDGDRLICVVGGQRNALVVALDKVSGKEVWRALPDGSRAIDAASGPGHHQPMIIQAGGTRQLIIWHPQAVVSLAPDTGAFYWEVPWAVLGEATVAMPVQSGSLLFLTTFYNGPLMLKLDAEKPGATVLWKGGSDSEIQTDGIHSVVSTPVIDGDHVYGFDSYGQLRALLAQSGERVWESQAAAKERARWGTGLIVRHGDRYFINNDRGELIIARLSPKGYEEIARTELIKPTTAIGARRERKGVNWTHPAYANRHIYIRNDEEVICASLAADSQ